MWTGVRPKTREGRIRRPLFFAPTLLCLCRRQSETGEALPPGWARRPHCRLRPCLARRRANHGSGAKKAREAVSRIRGFAQRASLVISNPRGKTNFLGRATPAPPLPAPLDPPSHKGATVHPMQVEVQRTPLPVYAQRVEGRRRATNPSRVSAASFQVSDGSEPTPVRGSTARLGQERRATPQRRRSGHSHAASLCRP